VPLGMRSTTLNPSSVPANLLAHGYRWEDAQWKEEPLLEHGAFGAMGGMLTSVADLSRYVGALLSAWPPRDGPETAPVRRSSLREMQQVWRPAPASVTRDAASRGIQMNSGGYGFGLRISQSCAFGHIVAHGGGLPGFGSIMRWLPEYGVGLVAFGNLTYTGWGGVANTAFDLLAKTGGLQPRSMQPSAALTDARNTVSRLIAEWDEKTADAIAAENLYLDRSKDRRRAEFSDVRAKLGACTPAPGFDYVENAMRGSWTLNCERGKAHVSITLAPTVPPGVQYLEVTTSEPAPRNTCAP
jgi:CubicO group peptidase (beta-lactamase class C family)